MDDNRILSDGDVALPGEWYVTSESKVMLRFFKSMFCYAQSVARCCLGESQIRTSDLLSGSVNTYYALFDLGIAALDLLPEYQFLLYKEFAFPDGEDWGHIRKARLTHLGHDSAIVQIQKVEHVYPYLAQIAENLERWKDLRELFSYGPWVKIVSIKGPTADHPLSHFVSRPAFFAKEVKADEGDKPSPFLPLQNEVKILVPSVGKLIEGFPEFVRAFIGEGKMYSWYGAAAHLQDALLQAPTLFCPNIPQSVSEESMRRLAELPNSVEKRFSPISELLRREFSNPSYLRELRVGSQLQTETKMRRQ